MHVWLLIIGTLLARAHKALHFYFARFLSVWPRAPQANPWARALPSSETQCTELPARLRGELARYLELSDLAAWSTAQRNTRHRLWSTDEVWRSLAADRGHLGSEEEMHHCAHDFRRTMFRLDGKHLRSLPRHQHCALLEEVTHMFRGLTPRDGDTLVEELCAVAEYALDAHDPACAATTLSAERFLETARRYTTHETLGEARVERFERAYYQAQQLHDLMDSSMKQHYAKAIVEIEESLWTQADDNFLAWPLNDEDDNAFDDFCAQ